jgi:hypothetical protein
VKTLAQKFLEQTYDDFYRPEFSAVQTISFDEHSEIQFGDGSMVWSDQFGYRLGSHPSRSTKIFLQQDTPWNW